MCLPNLATVLTGAPVKSQRSKSRKVHSEFVIQFWKVEDSKEQQFISYTVEAILAVHV